MNLDESTESGFIYKAKKKDRERVNFLQSQRSPVDHRYKLAYKWLCYHPAVHTSNEKMWHHTMMAAGFATEFLSCLRSMLFSFLATHRDVSVFTPCLTFSHGFYFFFVFPLLPTSLSLVRATSVTLIKFAPLTCASSVMLNQTQCNGASNSRSYTLLQCQYVSTVQLLCQNVWSHNTDALHNAVDVWWKAKKESPRSLTHIVVILCR